MKSFLKSGLLFALIITGRYMRSVDPVAVSVQPQSASAFFLPVSPTLAQYVNYADFPTAPVSQRKRPSPTWY